VSALDSAIPPKQPDRNLLVATWNIRAFGRVTEKWRSQPGDSPRRDLFDVRCIAEIVSRFDVIAIEEARENRSTHRPPPSRPRPLCRRTTDYHRLDS